MRNSEIMHISEILNVVAPERILCLDIEGNTEKIEQISLVNYKENIVYDQHFQNNQITKKQKQQIQLNLNKAEILIGYNINTDLNALSKRDFKLPSHTICLDVELTFRSTDVPGRLAERFAWLSQKGGTLASVAEFYGETAEKFHDSLYDAFCTVRTFKKMIKDTDGEVITPTKSQIKKYTAKEYEEYERTKPELRQMPERTLSKMPEQDKFQAAAKLIDKFSGKVIDQFGEGKDTIYEGVVCLNGNLHVVRLTHKEYGLFQKIQKFNEKYNLNQFYETILRPTQIEKLNDLVPKGVKLCFKE